MSTTEQTVRKYRADKSSDVARNMITTAVRIFQDAKHDRLHSSEINAKIASRIYDSEQYRRMVGFDVGRVSGAIDGLRQLFCNENIVFSYEIDGVRMSIESDEYREIDPGIVASQYAETGRLVYREDVNAIYF